VNWSGRSGSVAAWCSASGKDCNSSGADPRFLNATAPLGSLDLHLNAGSSAIGVGEGGSDAGAYPYAAAGPDVTPPAAISDLSAALVSDQVVSLQWTAPGDNGTSGTATAYDLRWSTSPITAANFSASTAIASPPVPGPSGTRQGFVMLSLTPGTPYYFAIKTRDEVNNWSAISNVLSVSTQPFDQTPPAAIQDLSTSP
jgi:hypothetical protein